MKNTIALLVLVGMLKAGECAISEWSKPLINSATGSGTLVEKINNGVTSGTATDVTITAHSDGTVSGYTLESQTPTSPDLDIDNSGVVTVTSGTIDYSKAPSFTLVVSATDGTAVTATVTLLVNAAPSFSPHSSSPCIADGATAGTDLIDLMATDANSDSITYAIASGNTNTDFTITNTGTVKVATGKTLNMTATSTYTLFITATDDSKPTTLVTTATVTATVSSTCPSDSGAAALAITCITILSALIVSLQ